VPIIIIYSFLLTYYNSNIIDTLQVIFRECTSIVCKKNIDCVLIN